MNAGGFEKLFLGVHNGLYLLTRVPEFQLDESEARIMGKSAADVARWYPNFDLAQKWIDHIELATILGGVYATRFAAYRIRKSDEKREAAEARAKRGQSEPPPAAPIVSPVATPDAPTIRPNGGADPRVWGN